MDSKTRAFDIDAIKFLAIIGVIVIHACAAGYRNPVGSFDWVSSVFWGSAARASVPLFLMCSGALFFSPERALRLKKLFTQYISRIVVAALVWPMAYKVYHLLASGSFSAQALLDSAGQVLSFDTEFHFYYLYIVLLFYLLTPIVRIITAHAGKRELQYVLGVWFALAIVYATIRAFPPLSLLGGIPGQWLMNMSYASVGYGVLGYYIRKYPIKRKWYLLLAAAGFALVFGGTWYMSLRTGSLYEKFFEGMSLGTALLATGVFGLLTGVLKNGFSRLRGIIIYVSKASFCIYLTHVFFIYTFARLGFSAEIQPAIASVPLCAAANALCSVAVYAALSRVPIVKKWLI